jgi:outer membrane protein OmpU
MRLLTAIVAAIIFPGSVSAAEVLPGGALDITVSGFVRFLWAYGDLEDKPIEGIGELLDLSSNDFRNDTEVHVLLRGMHDATGIEYGGTIEFEADTNSPENTDETWIFVRGGFGELRFGDTDSAAETMKIGAYSVAVGTGGIDGTVVDLNQPVLVEFEPEAENVTKIVYFSPVLGGFQLGVSYAPDTEVGERDREDDDASGDNIAVTDPSPDDLITAGLSYTGGLGEVDVLASVVGVVDPHDADDTWGVYSGAAINLFGASLAGGVGYRRFDQNLTGNDPPPAANMNDFNRVFFNVGAAYQIDRYSFSINYGRAISERGDLFELRQEDLVFGVEVGLLPGLVLSTEVARARLDTRPQGVAATEPDEDERRSWVGVTRLALSF